MTIAARANSETDTVLVSVLRQPQIRGPYGKFLAVVRGNVSIKRLARIYTYKRVTREREGEHASTVSIDFLLFLSLFVDVFSFYNVLQI